METTSPVPSPSFQILCGDGRFFAAAPLGWMAFFGCDGIDRYIRWIAMGGGCGDAGGWVGNVLIFAIDEDRTLATRTTALVLRWGWFGGLSI